MASKERPQPERGPEPPQRAAQAPASVAGPERLLALQRSAGKAAVARMLQRMALTDAAPDAPVTLRKHNQFNGGEPGTIVEVVGNLVRVRLGGDWGGATADIDPAQLDLAGTP